ncbi:esterase/lipase family protein [Singulisphaera sp. PoT]|uniref:esterase/lipase family protein n=1 Tax=Singulisphaera sp. PoT TaxID=3411797 RepID=UPI003BF56A39
MILAPLTIVAASFLGWVDISVQPSRGDRSHSAYNRSVASIDRPSERTVETLKRYDLERRYRHDVDGALSSLEKLAREHLEGELVYALAELSWVDARRLDRWRKAGAIDRYLDTVAYAHDYLTDPDLIQANPQRGSDPQYRVAMELYNAGLERLIRGAQSKTNNAILPEGTIRLKTHGGEQVLRVVLRNSPWTAEDIDKVILASDFEVLGMPTHPYQFGMGVPLIGVRLADANPQDGRNFYPPEMAFPLTAFLRPTSRLRDVKQAVEEPRECALELIDPIRNRDLGPPLKIPVEADLTTPLAYMWSRTDLNRYRWTGLLRPGEALGRANLMLLRPYEPGKIPVVMVHGLISSPLAWIPMLNELLRDPRIQERYQFMLYMYPTGIPLPIAAAGLRDSLKYAEQLYNADKSDQSFEKMVLFGHSMGGLLSHSMVVHSDDKFWRINSDRRFNEIVGPRDVLEELQHYFFFEPLPFVKRVVFLATPHHGSGMSRGVVGRVSSGLISEPDHVSDLLARLIKDNPDAFDRRKFRRLPTSIETLEPVTPNTPSILGSLLTMRPAPDVAFHSIIGSNRPGGVAQSTDGVVPYTSAHLEGVPELIVRSDHGVQKDPEAILEVRRILLEHFAANTAVPQRAAVVPPGRSQ